MWMKRARPRSRVFMVEPVEENLAAGRANFARHGYDGVFIRSLVGRRSFRVDRFLRQQGFPHLDVLHSDIQGYEVEMLGDCKESLERGLIDYVFLSTHSQQLHDQAAAILAESGMRIEVSSSFDGGSTSYDGLVFASRMQNAPVFSGFFPMGRREILLSKPEKLLSHLADVLRSAEARSPQLISPKQDCAG